MIVVVQVLGDHSFSIFRLWTSSDMHLVCSLVNWMCVSPCNCFLAVQEEQAQAMFANAKQVLDQFLRKSRIQGFGCWAGCLGHRVLGLLGF
jgi:hypothetical protein